MSSHLMRFTLLVLAPLMLSGATGRAEDAPRTVQVTINDFAFAPQTVTVAPGTQVIWTNRDDEPHTVRGQELKDLHSSALDQDQSYAFTFTAPGTYAYYCSLHPHMTGTVVVK